MAKAKHVVGDYWESPSGLGFTITEVEGDTITVEVDRMVRNREGKRQLEKRARVLEGQRDWDYFAGVYKKQRKKAS